jgi:hypothetical protein
VKLKVSPFLVGVALALLGTGVPGWCGSVRGVFALAVPNQPVPLTVLENPSVDGISLRFVWKQLEPRKGQFNWDLSDREIALAQAHRKSVSLSVTPGISAPDWVYADGAAKFTFPWDKPWGPPLCSEVSFPIPWDQVYMSKWQAFVRALGRRYSNDPSLALVKIAGINAQTPELFLPHSSDRSRTGAHTPNCSEADDVANWQSVGYRPSKVRTAWRTFAGTYAQSFPNQKLVLETGPQGMPPIDDAGDIIARHAVDLSIAPSIISIGKEMLGDHFIVQNDGLKATWDWSELPRIARPAPIAYQMAWNVTDDKACRMNGLQTPCDPRSMLQASMDRGIKAGAIYLEIYIADLLNSQLNDIITDTHQKLISKDH